MLSLRETAHFPRSHQSKEMGSAHTTSTVKPDPLVQWCSCQLLRACRGKRLPKLGFEVIETREYFLCIYQRFKVIETREYFLCIYQRFKITFLNTSSGTSSLRNPSQASPNAFFWSMGAAHFAENDSWPSEAGSPPEPSCRQYLLVDTRSAWLSFASHEACRQPPTSASGQCKHR